MYRIAVTNRHLCEGDFPARIRALAAGEMYDAILLREKDMTEQEYGALAAEVIAVCQKFGKKCILHNFPDVGKCLGHPYIHLPLPVLSGLSGEEKKGFREIGASVHTREQLREAERLGASYVTAGHIFATDCKRGLAPRGLDFLGEICREASVPVYGIGGISPDNEKRVVDRGAAGVCLMSYAMRH